ncbi:hypothetical protein LCGC14_2767100, partial [marine sediment metagenome]
TTVFAAFGVKMRTEIASYLSTAMTEIEPDTAALMASAASAALGNVTLTAATTLWDSLVDQAVTKLQTCGIPKNANLLNILTKAHQDVMTNLREAVQLTEKLISDKALSKVVSQYAERRSIEFSRQHAQYAGQMADFNAIQSTGFLFGTALLKSEQLREVGEFDANLSLQMFQQGLSFYIQNHASELSAGVQVELANAGAHNTLLNTSIQLLSLLSRREDIAPNDMLGLYEGLFSAELQTFDGLSRIGVDEMRRLFDTQADNLLRREVSLSDLSLNADRINKLAEEQRYAIGLGQVAGLLTNRVEFERQAATILTDQNRIKIVAVSENEETVADIAIREATWKLDIARQGSDIMVAPGGMSAVVPSKRITPGSVLGGALKVAGSVLSLVGGIQSLGSGGAPPGVGGQINPPAGQPD